MQTIKIHVKWNITGIHQSHAASDGVLFRYRERGLVLEPHQTWYGDPGFKLRILGYSNLDYENEEKESEVPVHSCVVHPSFSRAECRKKCGFV